MLNHENIKLIILYTVSSINVTLRPKLWPERMICPTCAMAYVAAKNDPFSHRRRWLMNSGRASGTSVSPIAPLTYLRILRRISNWCHGKGVLTLTSLSWPWRRVQNIRCAEYHEIWLVWDKGTNAQTYVFSEIYKLDVCQCSTSNQTADTYTCWR